MGNFPDISQFLPRNSVVDSLHAMGLPFGRYGRKTSVNPLGVFTPFWVKNLAQDENILTTSGPAEYSTDGKNWRPVVKNTIEMHRRTRYYLRTTAEGEKVNVANATKPFEIGGNLFSLTRKTWDENTRTQEANGIGEFESAFLNQKNLIHAKHVLLSAYTDKRAYNQLFKGCVNLEDIPKIIAEECQSATYSSFLSGCAKVTEIYCNITQWQQYTDFTLGLPAVGKFYKRESASIPHGKDGVPVGWEVVTLDINHLGNATPFWIKNLSLTEVNNFSLEGTYQYSWDALNWVDMSAPTGTLQPQQSVFLRTKPSSGSNVKITASTQPFEIGGNFCSLTRDEWASADKYLSNEFVNRFRDLPNLISIENAIILPNFNNSCFNYTFANCKNLERSAKFISDSFYVASLAAIFIGCKKLKSIYLSGEALTQNAFSLALSGCNSLNKIECYVEQWNGEYARDWVKNVAEKGVFYKLKGVEIPIGTNGIPRGWKVVEVEPPAENKPIAN